MNVVPPPALAADAGLSIPVCRPELPDAAALLPYLRQIDAARWYTNLGPLADALERRLEVHAEASPGTVVLAANATAGLTAALMALELPAGTRCAMPSWTFAATAHAAVLAGLTPLILDVDGPGGSLDPEAVEHAARTMTIGAVIPVSLFGAPVDVARWAAFRQRSGIPVVVDGAAQFDSVRAAGVPTVVSLHATKIVGVGEGAFVVCPDARTATAIRLRTNFGFADTRESVVAAANAKLSEYAAAVGLAALDRWDVTRTRYVAVASAYASALRGVPGVTMQAGFGSDWISATVIVRVPRDRLRVVEERLRAEGIGTRRWWGDGLAGHRAFAPFVSARTPRTGELAATTLGLPCWPDLGATDVARITGVLATALAGRPDQ